MHRLLVARLLLAALYADEPTWQPRSYVPRSMTIRIAQRSMQRSTAVAPKPGPDRPADQDASRWASSAGGLATPPKDWSSLFSIASTAPGGGASPTCERRAPPSSAAAPTTAPPLEQLGAQLAGLGALVQGVAADMRRLEAAQRASSAHLDRFMQLGHSSRGAAAGEVQTSGDGLLQGAADELQA